MASNLADRQESSTLIKHGPFESGDLVIKEEPWMHALVNEVEWTCYYCFQPLCRKGGIPCDRKLTLKNNRCSGCKYARYCSTDCQKTDWRERHKFECSALRRCVEKECINARPLYQLMFKIVAKLANRKTDKREFLGPKEGERTFWDLTGNFDDIKVDYKLMEWVMNARRRIALDLQLSEKDFSKLLSVDEFVGVFARIKCNAYRISGEYISVVGMGIYINASAIPHSCKPNAVRFFDGKSLSVRTTGQVESFSQVTVSLVNQLVPLSERQKDLATSRIICQCEVCSDSKKDAEMFTLCCVNPKCDAKIPSDERADEPCPKCNQKGENRRKEFQKFLDDYQSITEKPGWSAMQKCAEFMKLGKETMKTLCHPTNPLWINMNLCAACYAECLGLPEFVRYYRTAFELLRQHVSQIDPLLAWCAYRSITPHYVNEADLSESLKYLLEAKRILCEIWGADEKLCQTVRKELMAFYQNLPDGEKILEAGLNLFERSLLESGGKVGHGYDDVFPYS